MLIESGQDLTGLKETIDGLGEREVKDLLAVTVAELAHFYVEQREHAKDN